MDDFRKIQKSYCHNGGNRKQTYGCPCCRMLADQNDFKKLTRKLARHILAQKTRKFIASELAA